MWQTQGTKSKRGARRKGLFSADRCLGHKVKNFMTVIFYKVGSYRSLLQNDSNNKPAHRESVFLCSSVYWSYAAEVAQGSWGGNPIAQRTSVARELVHFGQFNF